MMLETSVHAQKIVVRYALWLGGVIVPYFFENFEGQAETVKYKLVITDYFCHAFEDIDVEYM